MFHKEFEVPHTEGGKRMDDNESSVNAINKVKEELEDIKREVKEGLADLNKKATS